MTYERRGKIKTTLELIVGEGDHMERSVCNSLDAYVHCVHNDRERIGWAERIGRVKTFLRIDLERT